MRSTAATILLDALRAALPAEPAPVAVAYSGGRDSAVLLWGLVELLGADLVTALHVDHGWRSAAERAAEAELVARWCERLGTALVSFPAPPQPSLTEASAREYRYECFRSHLKTGCAAIYLAHHADDQAETILMRLLNGRSWQGLAGMPARRGPFRRPLLGLRATVLASVAEIQNIPFFEDSTNSDPRWKRNFLRRQVFPLLTGKFPAAVESLNSFGLAWRQLPTEADGRWEKTGEGHSLPEEIWLAWTPLERQAQLLALANRGGTVRLSRRFLETVCAGVPRAAAGAGWRWSLTGGRVLWIPVARQPEKEYFVRAERGRTYPLGAYTMTWGEGQGGLFIPGVDPDSAWVWRSASKGRPSGSALVMQDGLVLAVVDPLRNRVVWTESGGEKLHNPGIFVTLVAVTPISTE